MLLGMVEIKKNNVRFEDRYVNVKIFIRDVYLYLLLMLYVNIIFVKFFIIVIVLVFINSSVCRLLGFWNWWVCENLLNSYD